MKVTIILVNYNGGRVTRECVDSLKRMRNQDYSVIIVDNGSTDASFDELKQVYAEDPQICVIATGENRGFAGGNNFGIRTAIEQGTEWILLLNNDTEAEEDFLDRMTENVDRETIYAPRINLFSDKKTPWYAAGWIDFNTGIVKNGNPEKGGEVSFASGCCMLFSCDVFRKIGELDEGYFMYYEDMDYCLRAREAGIRIVYKPEAVIYHKVGGTTGGEASKLSIYYNNRNRFYIIRQYREVFTGRCILYTAGTRLLRYTGGLLKNGNDKVILRAWKDFRAGLRGKSF